MGEVATPKRYEIRDAETGEKLEGTSFLLTPTGAEMHLLWEPPGWIGPYNVGAYYWIREDSGDYIAYDRDFTKEAVLSLARQELIKKALPEMRTRELAPLTRAIAQELAKREEGNG